MTPISRPSSGPRTEWSSGPVPTCRPSRSRADSWMHGATSSRSASCFTKWRPADVRSRERPNSRSPSVSSATLHHRLRRCAGVSGRSPPGHRTQSGEDPARRYPDAAALCDALRSVDLPSRLSGTSRLAAVTAQPRPDRPALIGRHAEHDRLARHLQDAARGVGALALLGGEPGVGKTRLAEDLLGEARDQGLLALTGRCYEAGTTPFSPFVDIVEQMLREVPAHTLREALGEDAPEVARLVPRIRRVWDDLPSRARSRPSSSGTSCSAPCWTSSAGSAFSSLSSCCLTTCTGPTKRTVGLLQYLAPHLSDLPVMVLGTYRDIEFDVGKPFEEALAAFVRQPQVFRVPVRCLPQTAVAELLGVWRERAARRPGRGHLSRDRGQSVLRRRDVSAPLGGGPAVRRRGGLEDRPGARCARRARRRPARYPQATRAIERSDPDTAHDLLRSSAANST